MKSFNYRFMLTALLLITVASCSSLPGKKDVRTVETKNKAAEFLKDGIGQFNAGRYSRALELFELAFQLNASVDHEEGIVASMNSIGRTYLIEGNTEKAFEIFDQALTIAVRLNDRALIMATKANLSDYYVKEEILKEADTLLREELDTYGKIDSPESALLAHNLSLVLRKEKKYDEALIWLNQSMAYNLKNDFFRALAADYYMLASIYSLMEQYNPAYQNALLALEYDKMIEYPQGIASDLEALSIISGKMGDEENERIYAERNKAVLDALRTINRIKNEQPESETTSEY